MTDAKDSKPTAKKPGAKKPGAKKPEGKPKAAEAKPIPPLPDLGRADGPWSFADAPADQAFVSFGLLKVPAFPTLHVQVEIDPKTRRLGAVSIGMGDGYIQLQVIAAPRGVGVWGDLRRAMARRVILGRGTAQAIEGDFGPELIVNRPIAISGRLVGNLTSRCVGIEGDRWLLRAVVGGRDPLSDDCVAKVNNFLSHCAIDRGEEAFPPGMVLALRLPEGGRPVEVVEATPEPGAEVEEEAEVELKPEGDE